MHYKSRTMYSMKHFSLCTLVYSALDTEAMHGRTVGSQRGEIKLIKCTTDRNYKVIEMDERENSPVCRKHCGAEL